MKPPIPKASRTSTIWRVSPVKAASRRMRSRRSACSGSVPSVSETTASRVTSPRKIQPQRDMAVSSASLEARRALLAEGGDALREIAAEPGLALELGLEFELRIEAVFE